MTHRDAEEVSTCVAALQALKNDDRLRDLKPRLGIDFSSNDYLALATAGRMRKAIAAAVEAGTPIGRRRLADLTESACGAIEEAADALLA